MSDNKENLELFAKQQADPSNYVRNLPEMQGLEEWQIQEVIERLKRQFADAASKQNGSVDSAELERQVVTQYIGQIVGDVRANFTKQYEGAAAADGTPINSLVVNESLDNDQRKDLMSKFKNYAMPIGLPGGVRSQVSSAARKAVFSFSDQDGVVFTRNEQDKDLLQVTINGDCDENIYVDVGNKCSIGIAYNKDTGAVDIIQGHVFHKGDDGQYKAVSLEKKGGFFRKKEDQLADVLESDSLAKEVRKSVKNLKLIACSNPKRRENLSEEDQPKRSAAALMKGKSKGIGGIIGLACMICAGAAAMVLTGFGIAIGVGMVVGAGSLTVSAISGGATTATATTGGAAASTPGAGAGISAANSAGKSIQDGSTVAIGATTSAAVVAGSAMSSTASTAGTAAASGAGGAASAGAKAGIMQAANGIAVGGEAAGSLVLKGATSGALRVENAVTGAYQGVANSGATKGFLSGVRSVGSNLGNTVKGWFGKSASSLSGAATQSGNAVGNIPGGVSGNSANTVSNTATNISGNISAAAGQTGNAFQNAANTSAAGINGTASQGINGVQGLPGQNWNAASGYGSVAGGGISGAAGQTGAALSGAAGQTGTFASNAAGQVGNSGANVYNNFSGTVNQVSGGVDNLAKTTASDAKALGNNVPDLVNASAALSATTSAANTAASSAKGASSLVVDEVVDPAISGAAGLVDKIAASSTAGAAALGNNVPGHRC